MPHANRCHPFDAAGNAHLMMLDWLFDHVGLATLALGDFALLVMFARWDARNFKRLQEAIHHMPAAAPTDSHKWPHWTDHRTFILAHSSQEPLHAPHTAAPAKIRRAS